ncbi:MAG: hypothetical protein ACOC8D_02020 [bacterium]
MAKTRLARGAALWALCCGGVLAGAVDPGAMMPVPKPKDAPKRVAPQPRKGKLYRHVIGFQFWYPAGWQIKELDEGLQLIPPTAAATPQGPAEVYFITGESVAGEGIAQASDPRVIQYLDATMRGLSPILQRVAQPAAFPTARGQGVMLEWRGRRPDGKTAVARAYAAIIRNHGVALLAFGLPEPLKARDADLRRMFASFDVGQGARDRQLVGVWKLKATTSITNWSTWETHWSRASAVSEQKSTIAFRADGTWTRTDQYHMIVGAGGLWRETDDAETHTGRWNAGSGQLYMVWKDNSWEDYRYQVVRTADGVQLRLACGKRGELWDRVR